MSIKNYRDLHVWQEGMDLVDWFYELAERLPRDERYNLCDQMRRAAVSIPINIAEGRGTGTTRMFLKHLSIASGSLAELGTLLLIAERRRYLKPTDTDPILDRIETLARKINALRTSLRKRLNS